MSRGKGSAEFQKPLIRTKASKRHALLLKNRAGRAKNHSPFKARVISS